MVYCRAFAPQQVAEVAMLLAGEPIYYGGITLEISRLYDHLKEDGSILTLAGVDFTAPPPPEPPEPEPAPAPEPEPEPFFEGIHRRLNETTKMRKFPPGLFFAISCQRKPRRVVC